MILKNVSEIKNELPSDSRIREICAFINFESSHFLKSVLKRVTKDLKERALIKIQVLKGKYNFTPSFQSKGRMYPWEKEMISKS